jgi:dihydropteroate synthase
MADVLSPRILVIPTLADAAREMERIGVSPGGVRAMTGKSRTIVIKVARATVPMAHIIKQQMLSLGGDAAVSKDVLTHAVDSTDVLIIGTHAQIRELASRLACQPFGLPDLGSRLDDLLDVIDPKPRVRLRARHHVLEISDHVHVMGVLNVTPDSFSDGGRYLQPSEAADRAAAMVADGADIVDVGGRSSRPGSLPIPESEEQRRIVPVVERIHEAWKGPISIDTCRAAVAEEALKAGASIVNDITAFSEDTAMAATTARFDAACVLMHMQGTPETMQENPSYEDLMGEITLFLRAAVDRALAAGVGADQIAIDPGIGFGKTTEHNLAILKRLPELAVLGMPILVGPSRKRFIGRVLDLPVEDRMEGTLATVAFAVAQGARIVRVHDVRPAVRTVRMVEACLSAPA